MDEKYLDLARDLLERDRNLRQVQQAMDRMSQLEYQLPPALQVLQWVRLVKTSAPFDAIRGATRALASLDERLKIEPISVTKATNSEPTSIASRQTANHWEQCLKWHMDKAAQRSSTIRSDVIRSAVLYDEIVGQIIHLPTQAKQAKNFGGETNRVKMMNRMGDFAVVIKNPQCVHATHSVWGLESVLCVEKKTPKEIREIWGDVGTPDPDDKDTAECWVLFDYCDYEKRVVWCVPGESEDVAVNVKPDSKELKVILDDKNAYPFLPWVSVIGGTTLNAEPAEQRLPLLYPIYKTEQWVAANIAHTLMMSEGIAKAASPDAKVTGPDPDSVSVEYGTPGMPVHAPPGHDYVTLQKQGLDPALAQMVDRLDGSIGTATLSRVLITAEAQSGESYSGFNLRVQTAIGSLLPYKSLGERFFEQAYRVMLYWAHFAKSDISGYGTARKDVGALYTIEASTIEPDNLYLKVDLSVDVPVDRLQRINGARMLSEIGVPFEIVADDLGLTDPEHIKAEWAREQFWKAAIQGKAQKVAALVSGQYQQDVMAAAQAIVEQQMAMEQQQQEAMAQHSQPEFGQPDLSGMSGLDMAGQMPPEESGDGAGGPGMAPPMGGMPPIGMMGEAATFEGATGQTRAMR
ncbi:hypothetical protein [Caudoviricetes sp.]|nr:hypothetical protein [Caudoviricetes sp.]UOF81131.1 hypothetical protein [Caudoviricetes sp.]UOF82233.1 hypothetical protein [Caudoviricetes sp.]UOF82476.1 hypothetical protein [Caudoviricetes sp.]UOF82630.1 hypothetical protein [Caudoviricetes sp.]